MEPETWLARFNARADELTRKGEEAQRQLAATSATATSADGAVTVTVGPGGVLRELVLSDGAARGSMAGLARSIMQTAGVAQRRAGASAMGTFASLGYSEEALAQFRQFLPPAESESTSDTEPRDDAPGYVFYDDEEDPW